MGWWASGTAHLHFDRCRVPVANLMGMEHEGFKTYRDAFAHIRLFATDDPSASSGWH
jgi:acyl-CoA dehydrogenase